MAFSIKNWINKPGTTTPLSAEGMEDLEQRISTYIDQQIDAALNTIASLTINTGMIFATARTTPDTGFLFCDGTDKPTASFEDLSAALGTTYGVAAAGYFRLPNLKGRVIVGAGISTAPGATAHALGVSGAGGEETVLMTEDQMPYHYHELGQLIGGGLEGMAVPAVERQFAGTEWAMKILGATASSGTSSGYPLTGGLSSAAQFHSLRQTLWAGYNERHPNMPPYLPLNFEIKT